MQNAPLVSIVNILHIGSAENIIVLDKDSVTLAYDDASRSNRFIVIIIIIIITNCNWVVTRWQQSLH
jgi:hypothetical protein